MSTGTTRAASLVLPPAPPAAMLRLLCVPHAGAGAAAANPFRAACSGDWSIGAVCFGGREGRVLDDPPASLDEMVADTVDAVEAFPGDAPLLLLGQCSGAILAFEAALRLRQRGGQPAALVAVSRGAPHLEVGALDTTLPDAGFLAAVLRLGGVPAEVAAEPDLLDLLLPALRADFAAISGYTPSPAVLDRPVLVLRSTSDAAVPAETAAAWSRHAAAVRVVSLSAGHFLLGQAPEALARALADAVPFLLPERSSRARDT